jgi:hypothetical protein
MQDAAMSELLSAAMETAGAPGVVMERAEAVGMAAMEEARITAEATADTDTADTDIRLTERAITVLVTTRVTTTATTPQLQASTRAQAALVWAWAAPVSAMDGGERDSFPFNRVSCHG